MTPEVNDWLSYAIEDLNVAKHLLNEFEPCPCEIICYHCQQASEKSLKALIIFLQFDDCVPKVHDITFLLDKLKEKIEIKRELYKYARVLTRYSVSARYPNDMKINHEQADEAVEYATEIIAWSKSILGL